MPRFAILCHEGPRGLHWDLLLEAGETLKTWALPQVPEANVEIPCEALPDHRLAYLDYEGPVAGGRGSVVRWDRGTYEIERQRESEWSVVLAGEKIRGPVVLRRGPGESTHWRLLLPLSPP